MKNQRGNTLTPMLIMITSVVAVGVVATVAIVHSNKRPQQTATTQTSTNRNVAIDETAGWKTYTNSQYSFSIMYPANAYTTPEEGQSYVRIQNYDALGPDRNTLNMGEYIIEISFISDSSVDWCERHTVDFTTTQFGSKLGLRGVPKPDGEISGDVKVACVRSKDTNIQVSVLVSPGDEVIANQIVDTLIFRD